jgi:hypothetical protein
MNALHTASRVRGPIEFHTTVRTEAPAAGDSFREDRLDLFSSQQGDAQSLSLKRAAQVKSGVLVYSDESSNTSQPSQGCSSNETFYQAPKTNEVNVYIHNV